MGSLNYSLLRRFVYFFVGFSSCLSVLFGFMNKWMLRLKGEYLSPEPKLNLSMKSKSLEIEPQIIDSHGIGSGKEPDENFALGFEESKLDLLRDEKEPESFLSFRFQRYEEFIDGVKGGNGEFTSSMPKQVVDDQEFDNSFSGSSSDEEFHDASFDLQVMEDSDGSLCNGDDPQVFLKAACFDPQIADDSNGSLSDGDEPRIFSKAASLQDETPFTEDVKLFGGEDDDFEVSWGSDSESAVSSSNFSLSSSLLDSIKDGYSSDDDDDDDVKINLSMLKGEPNRKLSLEEAEFQELSKGYENHDVEEDEELLAELKGLEEDVAKDEQEDEKEQNRGENSPEEDVLDLEDSNGMESQWEHQDLIEQLRMEIGKVKAIGLPTIFEDSEPPKMSDDLKPWKIDEKLFRKGGTMDEVHKFYKIYRERMRKFDIFNYQKMYAIGFLQLKDPLQSFSPQKISLATIVSQDCWPCKPKLPGASNYSMLKFTRELESDLETVYVGQLCLSWEFLRWEYGKALALWDSDPHELRRFNEVAGEFQQFQVLLQRFLEDEPFRNCGRVQNYVKNRCINRRLLQVPVIREDSVKEKMKQIRSGSTSGDAITSVIIIEMIEESIRLLWQLVRTDKDAATSRAFNPRKASEIELQNPEDAALLLEVQETLRKKQKRLKELTRSQCCILRKLQRNHTKQNYAGRVLCFFSQVDVKLVSRVLNMTMVTTDQLAWCSSKLENIEFVDNRIRREPSFLLFPCS